MALERVQASVEVLGGRVGVKVAVRDGRVVNVSVEYEDVAALARELDLPVKEVLRAATAAAEAAYPVTARTTHSASRRSASSGLTSSTRVMTAQRWPNGS